MLVDVPLIALVIVSVKGTVVVAPAVTLSGDVVVTVTGLDPLTVLSITLPAVMTSVLLTAPVVTVCEF